MTSDYLLFEVLGLSKMSTVFKVICLSNPVYRRSVFHIVSVICIHIVFMTLDEEHRITLEYLILNSHFISLLLSKLIELNFDPEIRESNIKFSYCLIELEYRIFH